MGLPLLRMANSILRLAKLVILSCISREVMSWTWWLCWELPSQTILLGLLQSQCWLINHRLSCMKVSLLSVRNGLVLHKLLVHWGMSILEAASLLYITCWRLLRVNLVRSIEDTIGLVQRRWVCQLSRCGFLSLVSSSASTSADAWLWCLSSQLRVVKLRISFS